MSSTEILPFPRFRDDGVTLYLRVPGAAHWKSEMAWEISTYVMIGRALERVGADGSDVEFDLPGRRPTGDLVSLKFRTGHLRDAFLSVVDADDLGVSITA